MLKEWRRSSVYEAQAWFITHEAGVFSDLPSTESKTSKATDQQDLLGVAAINTRLGWYYILKGESIRAEPRLQEAIVARERELGVNHPDTLTTVGNLALVLQSQGKYEEAESMNRRVLEGRERELGVNHPTHSH